MKSKPRSDDLSHLIKVTPARVQTTLPHIKYGRTTALGLEALLTGLK